MQALDAATVASSIGGQATDVAHAPFRLSVDRIARSPSASSPSVVGYPSSLRRLAGRVSRRVSHRPSPRVSGCSGTASPAGGRCAPQALPPATEAPRAPLCTGRWTEPPRAPPRAASLPGPDRIPSLVVRTRPAATSPRRCVHSGGLVPPPRPARLGEAQLGIPGHPSREAPPGRYSRAPQCASIQPRPVAESCAGPIRPCLTCTFQLLPHRLAARGARSVLTALIITPPWPALSRRFTWPPAPARAPAGQPAQVDGLAVPLPQRHRGAPPVRHRAAVGGRRRPVERRHDAALARHLSAASRSAHRSGKGRPGQRRLRPRIEAIAVAGCR